MSGTDPNGAAAGMAGMPNMLRQSIPGMMNALQQKPATPPGLGSIDQGNLSGTFGESDPMGTMPQAKPAIDPQMLQLMLSMRGMGQGGQAAGMQTPQPMGMPPQRPQMGAMGAMPQMGGSPFRPRGMAGRF